MTASFTDRIGLFAGFGLLVGLGALFFAVLGAINTGFDLDLDLQVSGANVDLPDTWETVVALVVVGALIIALSLFGSLVRNKYDDAKGKPLVRIGVLVGALALLGIVGRALQIVFLTSTYGSMLAYYATDGDLDDVRAELAKGPSREVLDAAVSRAAQYDNAAALALLLEAGADFKDESAPPERRRCHLLGTDAAFVETALAHGVTPATCPGGETALWEAVRFGPRDEEVARVGTLLRGAGWSTSATPERERQTPAALAAEKQWTRTLAALGGEA
ncbi:MAG: hypothetical protein R3B09_08625 [Nannocystaceae bacterium]